MHRMPASTADDFAMLCATPIAVILIYFTRRAFDFMRAHRLLHAVVKNTILK